MATVYTVQTPPHAGLTLTPVTPSASGDTIPCGGGLALLIVQTATTASVLTLPTLTFDGLTVTSRTVSVPGTLGATVLVPLPSAVYGPTVSPTWSSETGLVTFVIAAGN